LIDAVRIGDYRLRCKAAEGLGILRHGGAAVVETLAGALAEGVALRDPTAGLILATTALRALGRIGPDAVPTLAIALQSKRRQFRQLAAEMLGRMGPAASSTVPALILLLRDSSGRVRTMAALALGEMGKAAAPAIPVIEDAMSRFHIRDDAGASALWKIRRAIANDRG
jgi:HEAT repeat protein